MDALTSEGGRLSEALLKTKVLLHRLGHGELADWVNLELNGYPDEVPVPSYRVAHCQVMGNVQNALYVRYDVTLPTSHLEEKHRQMLLVDEFRQPIAVLEGWAKSAKQGAMKRDLAPEWTLRFNEAFAAGNWVERAWVVTSTEGMAEASTQVRSRLLDFVLGLQDKVGASPDNELRQAAEGIDVVNQFKSIVAGDNSTFIFGDHNTTSINNAVRRGDIESLAAHLASHGLPKEDIVALREAVAEDAATTEHPVEGPKVREWKKGVLGKTIDGTWKISTAVAAKLIADGITGFFGS
ncbi:hypothetical protein LRS14_05340 [Aquincola sp. J276]|nr:hypothetical protein [Aquincola sp. J276]